MDVTRLKDSFALVAAHGGDAVALHFYSDLFLRHPEVRDLFPVSMAVQRDHLIGALARIVTEADRADTLTPFLQHLGRTHRKFGTLAAHYPAVGTSLLATLEHFAGEAWTAEVAQDWGEAYELIAQLMSTAAAEDEKTAPAWWQATVVETEQRAYDITVLGLAVDGPPLQYLPGQSVPVETPKRPRLWRWYSPANPPTPAALIELHIRWVDGGQVSPALAGLQPGDDLRIGPPAGVMTLDPSGRDILMAAWSTGLAPLKAILGQIQGMPSPPQVHLFAGARRPEGLYDMPALEKLAGRCPWLTLTPVVAEGHGYPGETGRMADVITRRGPWADRDAYVAGPGVMVQETTTVLTSGGMPPERIRAENFGWRSER